MDVWVGDQVIVESPVDAGFCPLFSSCQRDKDVGSMTVHQPAQASSQDRTEQEHWTLVFCLLILETFLGRKDLEGNRGNRGFPKAD